MAKKIKLGLYGEPGVGKSVFALHAEKPFFITTDGNYEWLEDFGAKEEDHIQVHSWAEAKKVFKMDFDGYETIVIDLLEDLFKWCEYEYCSRNKLEHLSDVGFGKGYDITRNEFFIEMCKLIALDKHIIFIMHGETFVVKDRRGVEHTHYGPSAKIPGKVIDSLEGRLRYFLRCYCKAETLQDGSVVKKRYLSLIPKENEFGIHRGVNEDEMPQDIELDFKLFEECIGIKREEKKSSEKEQAIQETKVEEIKVEEQNQTEQPRQKRAYHRRQPQVEEKKEELVQEEIDLSNAFVEQEVEQVEEASKQEEKVEKQESVEQEQPQRQLTQQERIAAIKAKLEAAKKKNEEE